MQANVLDSIGAITNTSRMTYNPAANSRWEFTMNELLVRHADMNTGARGATTYGALDAFFQQSWRCPAICSARVAYKSHRSKCGICRGSNRRIDYRAMKITSPGYPLRPEIVESTYYLYH